MVRLLPLLPILLIGLLGACTPRQTSAEDSPRAITYVALGASDAVGVGARDPERDGWVPRFYRQLPAGSTLANLGVSGSLLAQAIDQQLPVAAAARPDVVTVWLAVNDLNGRVPLDRYSADLDRLLAALERTGAKVLIGNIPDVAQLPVYRSLDPGFVRAQVDAWNGAIADAAARHRAVLVDLHASWRELADHADYVAADGFHPSEEGYARLAELFWQALEADGGLERVGPD